MKDLDAIPGDTKITARNVDVYYGNNHAIKDVTVDIGDKAVTAFIGPSGCGKSTFLRCINRMNDTIDICKITGEIKVEGSDIYDPDVDPITSPTARASMALPLPKPNSMRSSNTPSAAQRSGMR